MVVYLSILEKIKLMKNIILILAVGLLLSLCSCGGNSSYVNGLEYKIECSPKDLISNIKSLKDRHPEYNHMTRKRADGPLVNGDDSFPDQFGNWQSFFFRLPVDSDTVIVSAWVYLRNPNNDASIYLMGRWTNDNLTGYKAFRTMSYKERIKLQSIFEELVLNDIKGDYKLKPKNKIVKFLKELVSRLA